MLEIELKLKIISPTASALDSSLLANHPSEQFELNNQYFDTVDLQLKQRRIAYRLRSKNDLWLQTFKTRGEMTGGLHQRIEHEHELTGPNPDLAKIPDNLWPQNIKSEDLVIQFRNNFKRRVWNIEWRGSDIEVVYDKGTVEANGIEDEVNEIELELKKGDPSSLYTLAEEIAVDIPCLPLDFTKAERGQRVQTSIALPWNENGPDNQSHSAWSIYLIGQIGRFWDAFTYTNSSNWLVSMNECSQQLLVHCQALGTPFKEQSQAIFEILLPLSIARQSVWQDIVVEQASEIRSNTQLGLYLLRLSHQLLKAETHAAYQ